MKKLASLMFATGLLATLFACDTSDSTTSPDVEIEDPTGTWALQSFQLSDGSIVAVPDPSKYTLELGVTEETVGACQGGIDSPQVRLLAYSLGVERKV